MSTWRCVNNPIKPFTQLCQIQLFEEGLCVLLCNSCITLQHAEMSLCGWHLTPAISSRTSCNTKQQSANIRAVFQGTLTEPETPPTFADCFFPITRIDKRAQEHPSIISHHHQDVSEDICMCPGISMYVTDLCPYISVWINQYLNIVLYVSFRSNLLPSLLIKICKLWASSVFSPLLSI